MTLSTTVLFIRIVRVYRSRPGFEVYGVKISAFSFPHKGLQTNASYEQVVGNRLVELDLRLEEREQAINLQS